MHNLKRGAINYFAFTREVRTQQSNSPCWPESGSGSGSLSAPGLVPVFEPDEEVLKLRLCSGLNELVEDC